MSSITRALLTGSAEGATDYIEADARDVATILDRAAATLDLSQPVAITMLGILPFIGDDDEARGIVTRLLAAVPAGSYLAITHSTSEVSDERVIEAVLQWNQVAPDAVPAAQPTPRHPAAARTDLGCPSSVLQAVSRAQDIAGHGVAGARRPCISSSISLRIQLILEKTFVILG